ncbi:MAG: hypothetical protein GXP40_01250 [Chloroflexi bacterium]|nr:hypothetical protein [Chloroflexota bacterium]
MFPRKTKHLLAFSLVALLVLTGCAQQTLETPTPAPAAGTETPFPPQAATAASAPVVFSDFPGEFILSVTENGYAHLFAYSPLGRPLTRLTSGNWNDITPALSPDGKTIAFASNRSGYWDIYLLDLASGKTTRLTNTQTYDAAPSWSPDGAWLATETYLDNSLEIVILPIGDSTQKPIRLTRNNVSDYAPAWAPQGRQIAFVSTRSGDSEIWLADLDRAGEDNFVNLSRTPQAIENHPVWTSDGSRLAWASNAYNAHISGIYVWDAKNPGRPAQWVGSGDWPAWDRNGENIVALLKGPTQDYLTAYARDGRLILQAVPMPGTLRGLLWLPSTLPDPMPQTYLQAAAQTPPPPWDAVTVTPYPEGPAGRAAIVPLEDVQAPYPSLHDQVDEAFSALRQRVIVAAGWDALANLENAFIPLTTPMGPGLGQDWLYTGRAFALNPLIANAGWMVAVRQEIGQQTYWHIYLRAQAQDGSMGEPLHDPLWDLSARYNLDPFAYEQGGAFSTVSDGYWVDFTTLAQDFGWQRLPSLPNWRTYYNGTRFAEFVLTGGLDWYSAMLELYPPEILITPTVVVPPTYTPTKTPRPTSTPVTPLPTLTPSLSPTPLAIFQIDTPTP